MRHFIATLVYATATAAAALSMLAPALAALGAQ